MATRTRKTKAKTARKPKRTAAAPPAPRVPAKPVALLVLGMHRSGTSALTRVCSLLGADLPKNLMGGNHTNVPGHWESWDLVVIHDELLASAGSNWHDWRAFNPDWNQSAAAEPFKQRLLDVLAKDFAAAPLFVVKDPRICRFVPVWREVLDRFGAAPRVALIVRNPLEVAASLARRNGFALAASYLLWLRHVLDAEAETRGMPRAFVDYDGLLEDWRGTVATVAARADIRWPRRSDFAELEIDRFLAAEHRHHVAAPAQLAARADVAAWVKEAYAVLRGMARDGEGEAARARLDAIRVAFNTAASAFGLALAGEAAQSQAQIRAAEATLAQVRAELAGARDEASRHAADRDRLSAELDIVKPALDELLDVRARLGAADAALAQSQAELAAVRDETSRVVADRDRLSAELDIVKPALDELLDVRARLGAADAALAQAHHELAAARETLGREADERARLAAALEAAGIGLREREEAVARVTVQCDAAAAAAARAEKERDSARLYLRESQSELQRLAGELDHAREAVLRGEAERARMAGETAAMSREFTLVRTRAKTLESEIAALGAAAAELPAARARAAESERRIAQLQSEMQAAQSRAAAAEAARDRAAADAARANAEADEARGKTDALERDLALSRALAAELQATVEMQARHLQDRVNDGRLNGAGEGGRANGSGPSGPAGSQAERGGAGANGAAPRRAGLLRTLAAKLSRAPAGRAARRFEHEAVRASRLFDALWYLKRNPDVAAADADPLWHYLLHGAAEGREPHPLFDSGFYRTQAPDLAETGLSPLGHYICLGVARGLDPHPLFDTDWYLQQNPDVATARVNPLYHFFKIGGGLGLDPHPLFDSSWYLEQNPDVARVNDNPLHHYVVHGVKEGRAVSSGASLKKNSEAHFGPPDSRIALWPEEKEDTGDEAYDLLNRSNLFDARWYLSEYSDVKGDPLRHFLDFGAAERRNPNPLFDVAWYLKKYPEIAQHEVNPLEHYLKTGVAVGYDPHPMFKTSWYLSRYPEAAKSGLNPLAHFLIAGAALDPNPDFSASAYLRQHPQAANTNALLHFLRRGGLPAKKAEVPRLQVFRRGAIGDVLLLTPAIKALRAQRTDTEIVVVTACPHLLENNPHIDYVVTARVPIEGADETFVMDYESTPTEHIVDSYARILNVSVSDRTPEIFLRDNERAAAKEALRNVGIGPNERFCVMQLATGWAIRDWPIDRFKEVAETLQKDGARVVVLGEAANPSIDFGIDLRGKTSVRLAAAIIETCSLMVTTDSGLMHIGLALRRPVISLFGCTDPYKRLPEWAMSGALFSDIMCRGCHHRQPPPALRAPVCIWNTVRCMEDLTAVSVIDKARTVLDMQTTEAMPASWRDMVEQSGLFDANWYLTKYKDIARAKVDPFTHFIEFGAKELRSPGPGFDPRWYKREYPEVAASGEDPLAHFLTIGTNKGYKPTGSSYKKWCEKFDTLSSEDRALIAADIASNAPVTMDVILTISPHNQDFMDSTIRSVAGQLFPHWRAWIVVDNGCRASVLEEARLIANSDPRFQFGDASTIEKAFGRGRQRNLVFVAGSAILREHALYMFSRAVHDSPNFHLIYSDEDLLDRVTKERLSPIFKPQFSPLLLAQTNYIGNCFVVSGDAIDLLPFLDDLFDADALVEKLLPRLTRNNTIRIPSVLFHQSTKSPKPPRPIPLIEADGFLPRFSIIIPTKDRLELLQPCIESIERRTNYPSAKIEIIVVDNGSTDHAALDFLRELQGARRARVLRDDGPFNFSRLNNLAAAEARHEVLLLLNNDTIINEPLWLRRIATHVVRPDVAAVGAKLLYPDHTIQHAGVILGIQGVGAHNLVGFHVDDPKIRIDLTREMAAVTGACLAMRREVFDELGGLDPAVAVAFNDTLLCASALNAGYRNIYIKEPLLIHFESKSRGYDDIPERKEVFQQETLYARRQFKEYFRDDPYYSSNLCLQQINELAFPPRKSKPWRIARRNLSELKLLFLSARHEIDDELQVALKSLAFHLRDAGHEIYVGGLKSIQEPPYPGCRRVYLSEPEEAASFAVTEGIDCIIAETPPFFSVVRWLAQWPRTFFIDHGEPPADLFPNAEQRGDIEVEKRFCFSLASATFVMPKSVPAEGVNISGSIDKRNRSPAKWEWLLVKLEQEIVDLCKND